jgi:hypothetical protein
MPKRTIGEAQQVLDGLLLAPAVRRDKEAELQQTRDRFRGRLDQDLDSRHEHLQGQIGKVRKGLIRVASDLHALRLDADNLNGREYRQRYDKAMAQKKDLERRADEIEHAVKVFRREERKPDRAIDEMLEKYPILKPTFTF